MTKLLQQAAVLALVSRSGKPWYTIASLIEEAGGALAVVRGEVHRLHPEEATEAKDLGRQIDESELESFAARIQAWAAEGIQLVTVLDDDYPVNLREVYNHPPFVFVRGALTPADTKAVAVVGTRRASAAGLAQARTLAGQLASRGATVVSGLARGIDSAAHEAALEAGGRTLAVFGSGINRIYPPENKDLARRILESGAHVSQFWPDASPTRATFPMRNVVTSGLALGTVVIEAHGHSGASMQARLCLDHGKRLFLLRSLVMQEAWAQRYAARPGVVVVDSVDDVVTILDELLNPPVQLQIC